MESTSKQLQDQVYETWMARLKYDEARQNLYMKLADWRAFHSAEIEARDRLRDSLLESESSLRESAVAQYEKTKDKHFVSGVSIRIHREIEFDDEDALEWATKKGVCLQLDEKAFKNAVKAKIVPKDLASVSTEARAYLDKDLPPPPDNWTPG